MRLIEIRIWHIFHIYSKIELQLPNGSIICAFSTIPRRPRCLMVDVVGLSAYRSALFTQLSQKGKPKRPLGPNYCRWWNPIAYIFTFVDNSNYLHIAACVMFVISNICKLHTGMMVIRSVSYRIAEYNASYTQIVIILSTPMKSCMCCPIKPLNQTIYYYRDLRKSMQVNRIKSRQWRHAIISKTKPPKIFITNTKLAIASGSTVAYHLLTRLRGHLKVVWMISK